MSHSPDLPHRRSIRLHDYDYSQAGAYFITICVFNRECLLGEIAGDQMRLSTYGAIVDQEWQRTPSLRPQVELDEYVIMPNHFHAILVITGPPPVSVGAYCNTPLQTPSSPVASSQLQSPSQTVGAIMRGFKAASTKQANVIRKTPGLPFWQRNYWEHVIRDEDDLAHLREYILNNPARWAEDREYPVPPVL